MSMTDPIADLLTRIRNAVMVKHPVLELPSSKMKVSVVELLKKEGFLYDYRVLEDGKQGKLQIRLKYDKNSGSVIKGLKKVSKPGRRVYVGYDEIPRVLNGLGIAVISNTQGIMTGRESKSKRLGGEWVCSVW